MKLHGNARLRVKGRELLIESLGLRRAIVEWYAPNTARGINQTFSLLDVDQDNAHDLLLLQLAYRARGLACSSDARPPPACAAAASSYPCD